MSKHHMYDESPMLKHDEAGGTKVVKTPKKEEGDGPKEKGVEGDGFPLHAKHLHERHLMHANQEHEHALHEHHHPHETKEPMHRRHEKETKEMHMRHEKEAGEMGGKESGAGGATGEPSEKIEKGTK